jgi:hypothetical protein
MLADLSSPHGSLSSPMDCGYVVRGLLDGSFIAWDAHAAECHAWVLRIAEEISAESKLPINPTTYGSPYVEHFRLAVFIYRRLFQSSDLALFKRDRNPGWVLEGFQGTPAAGTEQELDAVLDVLDNIIEREKRTANQLLAKAHFLEQELSSICSELKYAIAARRLRKGCDFVHFF